MSYHVIILYLKYFWYCVSARKSEISPDQPTIILVKSLNLIQERKSKKKKKNPKIQSKFKEEEEEEEYEERGAKHFYPI